MKMSKFLTLVQIVLSVMIISLSGSTGCKDDENKTVDPGITCPVTLLQTTDMHDRVTGVGPYSDYSPDGAGNDTVQGGFSRLATEIDTIRTAKTAEGSEVLLVDSGDYDMGTVYDFLWNTDPAPFRFIQQMEYDVITLGNHEFDYGPAKLALMINAAKNATGGFTVPIVASNTVFDSTSVLDDDLEALKTGNVILPTYVKTLPNGLKIGFIGLMGDSANTDSPNAGPVTFQYDYTDAAVKAAIQAVVDDLRNTQGANVVIALSHSGVKTGTSNTGDDITLAENITGIDIIASGHDHDMTSTIIDVANTATGHVTHIFCAGAYTTNLAELNFTATQNIGAINLTLTNHTIDDSIDGNDAMDTTVAAMNATINGITGVPDVNASEITMNSGFSLTGPSTPGENGLGNLLADALRYAGTSGTTPTIGAFATGVIRDEFYAGEDITFADLFSMVPLGITTAADQSNSFPGYPLLKVYLTGTELYDMCKFDRLIVAFNAYTQNYVHLSGMQYTIDNSGTVTDVNLYTYSDYKCTGSVGTTILKDSTLYPLIVDSYVMAMLLSPSIQGLLSLLGVSIHPKFSDESAITTDNMLDARLDDDDNGTNGVQEVYAWSALISYFSYLGATIPADPYNLATTVNFRVLFPGK